MDYRPSKLRNHLEALAYWLLHPRVAVDLDHVGEVHFVFGALPNEHCELGARPEVSLEETVGLLVEWHVPKLWPDAFARDEAEPLYVERRIWWNYGFEAQPRTTSKVQRRASRASGICARAETHLAEGSSEHQSARQRPGELESE